MIWQLPCQCYPLPGAHVGLAKNPLWLQEAGNSAAPVYGDPRISMGDERDWSVIGTGAGRVFCSLAVSQTLGHVMFALPNKVAMLQERACLRH